VLGAASFVFFCAAFGFCFVCYGHRKQIQQQKDVDAASLPPISDSHHHSEQSVNHSATVQSSNVFDDRNSFPINSHLHYNNYPNIEPTPRPKRAEMEAFTFGIYDPSVETAQLNSTHSQLGQTDGQKNLTPRSKEASTGFVASFFAIAGLSPRPTNGHEGSIDAKSQAPRRRIAVDDDYSGEGLQVVELPHIDSTNRRCSRSSDTSGTPMVDSSSDDDDDDDDDKAGDALTVSNDFSALPNELPVCNLQMQNERDSLSLAPVQPTVEQSSQSEQDYPRYSNKRTSSTSESSSEPFEPEAVVARTSHVPNELPLQSNLPEVHEASKFSHLSSMVLVNSTEIAESPELVRENIGQQQSVPVAQSTEFYPNRSLLFVDPVESESHSTTNDDDIQNGMHTPQNSSDSPFIATDAASEQFSIVSPSTTRRSDDEITASHIPFLGDSDVSDYDESFNRVRISSSKTDPDDSSTLISQYLVSRQVNDDEIPDASSSDDGDACDDGDAYDDSEDEEIF
jgi:hypothetical protein